MSAPASSRPAPKAPARAGAMYLYAVAGRRPETADLLGVDDEPVSALERNGLWALVSPAPAGRIRPERRRLAAHQRVARHAADSASALPMAFGSVAPSRRALDAALDAHADAIRAALQRVAGRAEMTVRLALDVPDLFRRFVESDADLRDARDALLTGAAGLEDRMALGRLFERTLQAARERASWRLSAALAPGCAEVLDQPCRGEKELVRLACLVERDRAAEFDARVHEAAGLFDDDHLIDVSGPWPAGSFVDLRLDLDAEEP